MTHKHDLVIIGGGVGGLVTSSVAGQLGLDVVLIEKEGKLGGDCLHYGCVPSKTLIRSAEVAHDIRRAGDYGLDASAQSVDLGRVMDRVRNVIETIQVHDDPDRFRSYGVDVRFGEARFIDAHQVEVNGEIIAGRRFLIATGSRPAVPPVPGLEQADYLTNENIFAQRELPRRLAVMGGGPIGLELAQAFARLGSEVTVIEMADHVLPREDPELSKELEETLRREGITLHTGTTVESVSTTDSIRCLECRAGDEKHTVEADALLVAAGRQANIESLDLEAAGVKTERGLIRVDRRMRSSRKHIFAVGDVCGPLPFTHVAEYQAGIVIANAIFRVPRKADYSRIPWCTYTAPELARVGLTEAEARERGMDVEVARFRFSDVDRALAEGHTDGLFKFVTRKGRLVGASILGPRAGELIHEPLLAMQAGLRLSTISGMVHAYPTLAEGTRRTVNTLFSPKLFAPGTRRLVHWINRLLP